MLYMGYILRTPRNGSAVSASLPLWETFYMRVSVRHFEWHCLCQTADWRRHIEKCCANEIAWPTSFSAIHFSKDTEGAFIQVNHHWSLKWKRGFSEGRGTSIIYYSGVARHLGDNAVLQAYKTWSLLSAGEAIVVCFEHVSFHPCWQMKKNMSPIRFRNIDSHR